MFRLTQLLFLTLFELSSLVKTAMPLNEYTSTIENIRVPCAHSTEEAPRNWNPFLNKDNYGSHNIENIQYKRHPKSVFIVHPENQRPPTQSFNLDITESHITIPPPTTVIQTCGHRPHEHSTTPKLPLTTPSIPTTDSATSVTSLRPTNPSSPSTSSNTMQPPCSSTTTIDTTPTMTIVFSTPTTDKTPIPPSTRATISPSKISPPTSSPPTIKDPTGTGETQCSFNGLYRANNFSCDQYFVCINGATYLMDCPNGLAFNDDKKTCDWPGNVEGCNPRAFEDFECPYDNQGESNIISTFRYRDSCSQFIACYRKKPRLLSCRKGFSFDEDSRDCVHFKKVMNCKNIIYSL